MPGMELLLDGSSPLHWLVVAVLLVSGALTAWIGLRDGVVRREMRTNSGPIRGRKALAAGAYTPPLGSPASRARLSSCSGPARGKRHASPRWRGLRRSSLEQAS